MDRKRSHIQTFIDEYESTWPCLKRSKKADTYAYCSVCDSDFTISHGGRSDCRRHIEGPRHVNFAKLKGSNRQLSSMLKESNETTSSVIKAEALFTNFLIEHNCPLSIADHSSKLFKVMFPDSKIAKKFSCARTKTTCIVKSFAKSTQEALIEMLKVTKFALATDGSNTTTSKKLYPIVVTYSDQQLKKNVTCVLSLPQLEIDSTGKNIYDLLDNTLKKFGLSWQNCTAFCADNASVMLGQHKGVSAFVLRANDKIFVNGCACHLIHLTALHASKELDFDIEDFLVNVYYYLRKSSKRLQLLKACQDMEEIEKHKIVKYGSTRWLSMGDVITRFLEQWAALKKFFCDEEQGSSATFLKLKEQFSKPVTKLYLLFLHSIIPVFNTLNLLFQSDAPKIHIFRSSIENFFTELLARFIKPSAFASITNIFEINFSKKKNQKSNEDLVIGAETRQLLNEIDATERKIFYANVRKYFKRACSYVIKKFPLEEELFQHAVVADIKKRAAVELSSVRFFFDLFDYPIAERDSVETEFVKYQIDTLNDEIINSERIDEAWYKVGDILDYNGAKKYKFLPKFMNDILIIPHSNASCERVFSIINNNVTDNRNNLGIETLEALIIEKCKPNSSVCYETNFSSEELTKAKKATSTYLTQM